MICTKCNTQGVEVLVLGKTSWYCRQCKDDILPIEYPPNIFTPLSPKSASELWNEYINPMKNNGNCS